MLRNFLIGLGMLAAIPVEAAETEKPRLVVLVVFDQMRGDYLEKWKSLFVEGGFARLQKEGAWYNNCHYPYGVTTTGPGHASMLTGTCPDVHGIINNNWYEVKQGATVNCSASTRYQRIPPLTIVPVEPKETTDPKAPIEEKKESAKALGSPERLIVPTVGDVLKEKYGAKSRVVGLSFKDRSALLPPGRKADAVYWLDSTDGQIVTSSYYRDAVHPWVTEFNKNHLADQWFNKDWTLLLPKMNYEKFSGPDEVTGEGKGIKQGIVFPHLMDGGAKKIGKGYYEALFNSPFGNDMLFELVKKAVVAERLGQDETPDLLTVSFSSNDAIGHCWGPDSQEVLDATLRSDRMMVEFLKFLDEKVGRGKYLLALTADHGICPLPEVSAKLGKDAKRLPNKKILTDAEAHLRKVFEPEDEKSKTRWIEQTVFPWIYLNKKVIASKKLKESDVVQELTAFLQKQDGILRVFNRAELEGSFAADDAIGRRMKRSYHAERSGDLGIVLKPYWLPGDSSTGTTHGSPHAYDTHVPLLVFGTGVQPGIHSEEVQPQSIAAIFSQALGIDKPAKAEFPVPPGLWIKK